MKHIPVLLNEVVGLAKQSIKPDSLIVDATVGGGGHSVKLANLLGSRGILLILDQDPEAINRSVKRIKQEAKGDYELITIQENFDELPNIIEAEGLPKPSFVLADLGVSSFQLEIPERGFSFLLEGPLDMRMDNTKGPKLFNLLRSITEEQLSKIIKEYGEERHARKISEQIISGMKKGEIHTTLDLARIIEEVVTQLHRGPMRIHPATKTFQALRIWVNDELGALQRFVEKTPTILNDGGILAIITFHSLEDRIVKLGFKKLSRPELFVPKEVILTKDQMPKGLFETGKPIRPLTQEIIENPRSRSAKLRWLKKKII